MLQTFVLANETQRILMLEKTNFNLSFLKTIVEVFSDSSVLQAVVSNPKLGTLQFVCADWILIQQ
jgi:hypothetical protein